MQWNNINHLSISEYQLIEFSSISETYIFKNIYVVGILLFHLRSIGWAYFNIVWENSNHPEFVECSKACFNKLREFQCWCVSTIWEKYFLSTDALIIKLNSRIVFYSTRSLVVHRRLFLVVIYLHFSHKAHQDEGTTKSRHIPTYCLFPPSLCNGSCHLLIWPKWKRLNVKLSALTSGIVALSTRRMVS